MSGTKWTEPGQGATYGELWHAAHENRNLDCGASSREHAVTLATYNGKQHWERQSNLALTGEPLTAEDVANIGRAK